MVSDRWRWAVAWRLAMMLALTASVGLLIERTQFYATALIGTLLIGALGVDILRRVEPGSVTPRSPPVRGAGDNLQALLDTVTAALIVVRPDGRAALANRAARRLTRADVARLSDVETLGADGASRILGLPPGQPELLQLVDGRHVLVSISDFELAAERQRLVALQFVSGDLDVVELKAWRDMLRVLRHEIMNSLTPIASLSESLAGSPSPADLRTSIEAISRRSRGLMQFVDRYREVTEPVTVKPERLSADVFLKGIERLMGPDCAAAHVRPVFTVDPPSMLIRADPALLEQAIINLLKNAVEAVSGVPSPQVEVRFEASSGEVCLRITDNGGGIAAERREQVFLPFFSTKKHGSGIGLSVSRNIALAHGGRILYEPATLGGSEFRLFLGPSSLATE